MESLLLPPQSTRGFSALARLYYLACETKTAMLRRLLSLWNSKLAKYAPNLFALFHLLFPSFNLESLFITFVLKNLTDFP